MLKIERRAIEILDLLVRTSGLLLRDVDQAAGFSRGTTGNILSGRIRLRFAHIFQILEACRTDPQFFFNALFPPKPQWAPSGKSVHQELMEAVEKAGLMPPPDAPPILPPGPLPSTDELVEIVQQRVVEMLAREKAAGHGAGDEPSKKPPKKRRPTRKKKA